MDIRVIEVTKFKSEIKIDFLGHYHCYPLVLRAIALLFEQKWTEEVIDHISEEYYYTRPQLGPLQN